jgi:hypothetical protein
VWESRKSPGLFTKAREKFSRGLFAFYLLRSEISTLKSHSSENSSSDAGAGIINETFNAVVEENKLFAKVLISFSIGESFSPEGNADNGNDEESAGNSNSRGGLHRFRVLVVPE